MPAIPQLKVLFVFVAIFLFSISCFGQTSLFKNSTYRIDNDDSKIFDIKDTIFFTKTPHQLLLPKFSTLRLKFKLHTTQDSTVFIYCNNQGYVKLFEIKQKNIKLVGETGFICPYHKRSIRSEVSFIKLNLQKDSKKEYFVEVKNYTIKHNNLVLTQNNYAHFQESRISKTNTFVNKYGQPIFLGAVALILLITIIQCIIFREKIYFLYLLYIILTLLRVAMGIGLLVVEDYFPALNNYGFISSFSQTFSFLSIITYLFFIREFAHIPQKSPKLDKIIKVQLLFTIAFLLFEPFIVVEKYTVPLYITIFNIFEILETTFAVLIIIGLFKLYDRQNRYLIFGVCSLFLIAFIGQQLILRLSSLSRFEQENYLQILWGIAYLGEMTFFTIGLFDRAAIMKKIIVLQGIENQKLIEAIQKNKEKDSQSQPSAVNIATNKGLIIIQQTDIIRVEASGNYTVFHLADKKQIMASNTMAEFEDKLNTGNFIRVHKSHIVNLQSIAKYNKGDGGMLTLHDDSEIPVSRSRKEELLKKLFTV